MKVGQLVFGIIILFLLVIFGIVIYENNKSKKMMANNNVTPPVNSRETNVTSPSTTVIKEQVLTPVPVIVYPTNQDCRTQSYRDNLEALRVDYIAKRNAYNAAIGSSDPNSIQLYKDMNTAYNLYMNEKEKCIYLS